LAALQQTIEEIERKRAAGKELMPELRVARE
jgi:hypothetical protein